MDLSTMPATIRAVLDRGVAIPAMPLALTAARRLDERRQRALIRSYCAAGAGGLAVGVHTTQFAIRDARHGLFEPVLALAAEELSRADSAWVPGLVRAAGICGETRQAVAEAELARDHGYQVVLLNTSALRDSDEDAIIQHCRTVADVIPLFGFYLQPSVGGRVQPYRFWRKFAAIENVVAVKISPWHESFSLISIGGAARAIE
jgi:dihydrodipicolinate synthase/N-acetylneuraminate lyase